MSYMMCESPAAPELHIGPWPGYAKAESVFAAHAAVVLHALITLCAASRVLAVSGRRGLPRVQQPAARPESKDCAGRSGYFGIAPGSLQRSRDQTTGEAVKRAAAGIEPAIRVAGG